MEAFRWFLSYLKKYRWLLISGTVLVLFSAVLLLINPKISGVIVDDVIKKAQYERLPKLLVVMIAVSLLRSGCRYLYLLEFEVASQGMLYTLRDVVFRKMMKEDFNFFNRNRTGDLMSRQTGDMDAIRHFVAWVIYQVIENVCMFLFALVMIIIVCPQLAAAILVLLPLTALVAYFQSKAIHPAFTRARQCFSSLNTFAQENISGNRVVKAFAKEDFERQKFMKENDAYRDAQVNSSYIWMKFVPLFHIMSNMMTIVLMLVGGAMVIGDSMSLGDMVTVNGYLWMLNSPLGMAGWLINDIQRFNTSLEKIYATYSEEPDVKPPALPKKPDFVRGEVEFRHVDYFAFDEIILRDISFKVKPGQTVGIIGATGAGKSTLVNLICRFYDVTNGQVLVDGVDVREMDFYSLRGNIGIAMQDVFLFSDTIEGNIAYANPEVSFERVREVAEIANADEFITKMPEGYDTIVGERGIGLSGGQKQRISLARALLKEPAIVILDDTTSAVDMETEEQIQKALSNIAGRKTVFIIAHRISSIMKADLILVLDNGRIVEEGTHETLLAKNGYYATVFHHQYGEFETFKEIRRKKGQEV